MAVVVVVHLTNPILRLGENPRQVWRIVAVTTTIMKITTTRNVVLRFPTNVHQFAILVTRTVLVVIVFLFVVVVVSLRFPNAPRVLPKS